MSPQATSARANTTSTNMNKAIRTCPMKVTLRGSHLSGAPIHAIAARAADTCFSVEGVVSFTPQAGAQCLVVGELKRGQSVAWIEERDTGKVVTEKVVEH